MVKINHADILFELLLKLVVMHNVDKGQMCEVYKGLGPNALPSLCLVIVFLF